MKKNKKITKSISILIIFSFLSKILGFLRESLIASKLGVGYEADTYIVAIAATTFLATMFSNSISSSIIPISINSEQKYGKKGKYKYFSNIINLTLLFSIILIIFSYILSPYIIKLFAYGFEGEQFELAVKLNRLALPIIISIIITASIVGYLQSEERFTSTALIGISLNVIFIIYLFFLGDRFKIKGLIIAAVVAYFSQIIILIPEVVKSKYKYTFCLDFLDSNLIQTLKLSIPVMIGLSAQQINIIVDKTMASSLVEGSISSLNYAAITSLIIIEVFITSIITVIFPIISNAVSNKDLKKLRIVVIKGFKLILFITIPASIGMIVLSIPIIRVLFEHGKFNNNATTMTAQAFILYSISIVFASLKRLSQKIYYSFGDTRTPMINSIIEVFFNIVLNLILVRLIGYRGLALSTSIAIIITSFFFLRGVSKLIGGFNLKKASYFFIKLMISATLMGVIIWIIGWSIDINEKSGFFINSLYLTFSTMFGILCYFIICRWLNIREIDEIRLFIIKNKY